MQVSEWADRDDDLVVESEQVGPGGVGGVDTEQHVAANLALRCDPLELVRDQFALHASDHDGLVENAVISEIFPRIAVGGNPEREPVGRWGFSSAHAP